MSKVIAYVRVSTEKQDLDIQKQIIFEYAHYHKLLIDEVVESETSSRLAPKERKIDILNELLEKEDLLIVAELSRLGRNMLETLNIINELTDRGVKIAFIRQPELSTNSPHGKLLMAIYSYFAESERDFISIRTKHGLATARAKGKVLGRPKNSRNKKESPFDKYSTEIKKHLKAGVPLASVLKIVNGLSPKKLSYTALRYWVERN